MRIAIVDDERDTVDSMSFLLESEGHVVLRLYRADELTHPLEEFHPDVLVMDICMPGVDGLTAMRSLRASSSAVADLPAVAITGMARQVDREAAIKAGFDSHLAKPVGFQDVLRTIYAVRAVRKRLSRM